MGCSAYYDACLGTFLSLIVLLFCGRGTCHPVPQDLPFLTSLHYVFSLRHCESPSILSSSRQLSLNAPSIGVSFFAPQWHLPTSQLAKSLLVSLPAAFLTPPRKDRRPFIPPSPSPPCHHHTKPALSPFSSSSAASLRARLAPPRTADSAIGSLFHLPRPPSPSPASASSSPAPACSNSRQEY